MSEQTFGNRLAWLREVAGVGSREIGVLAGISESYASVVERSGVTPSFKTATAIAGVFGVDITWLASGAGGQPDESDVRAAVARARERMTVSPEPASPNAPAGTDAA